MCGKGYYPGLSFNDKKADQSLGSVSAMDTDIKYIHRDRELCKVLEWMTDEKLTGLSKAGQGRDVGARGHELLHPVADVGVDQDGDGGDASGDASGVYLGIGSYKPYR